MKITLYKLNKGADKTENAYINPKVVEFIHGNMVITKDNLLPSLEDKFPNFNKRKYIHFEFGTSPTYKHVSNGKINTRITYKAQTKEGRVALFCKLNWLQKQKLKHFKGKALYQEHPIAFLAFISNLFFAIINLFLFFSSS